MVTKIILNPVIREEVDVVYLDLEVFRVQNHLYRVQFFSLVAINYVWENGSVNWDRVFFGWDLPMHPVKALVWLIKWFFTDD